MSGDQIRWGILGCGDVTEVKSGPALKNAANSTVLQVMRRDGDKAQDYARRHNVPNWTDDAEAMICNPDLNAIYIATPPSTHADYAIRAMRAGKDVLVEKPMARSPEECAEMINAQEETGRKLVVAFYRRALPRFEKFRDIATNGEIGALRIVEVRQFLPTEFRPGQAWKIDPQIGGGGLFADMQTHALDWLTYAFGTPVSVAGLSKRQAGAYAAEDCVSYLLDFGHVPAVGLFSYAAGHREEAVILHGSSGTASMGFFRPSPISITRGGSTENIDLPDPPHVHQPFIEQVIAHFLHGAPNPCSAKDAIKTNDLMERILT